MSTSVPSGLDIVIQLKDLASKGIAAIKSGVEGLNKAGEGAKAGFQSLESASGRANAGIQGIGGSVSSLIGFFGRLAVVVGAAGAAKSFVDVNSSAEKTKLMLTGLYGDVGKAAEAFAWIQREATNVPFSMT
ncbi:MAG: hypothetical protein M0Z60_03455, partial [Nitrospiraceae bacterium]|nr:hypothetical protein [Nitrospiraceae bacterium]